MYLPKGTTITYRVVTEKGKEKEMILIDKEVFESMVTMLGFEKKEQKKEQTEG